MTRTHGQGKINLELYLRLAGRGYGLRLLASWIDAEIAESKRVRWDRIPVSRLPTNWLRCERFRRQAERRLRGAGEVTINNGAAAVVPTRLNIVMFVHTAWLHSPWRKKSRRTAHSAFLGSVARHQSQLERRAFAMSRKLVALSDQVRQELIEYCDIAPSRIEVIVPGVDCEVFRPLAEGEENLLRRACRLGTKDDRRVVLFVGEIRSRRKNLDLVLRAAVDQPATVLAVVGSTRGSGYPALAERMGIAERVHFLGHRSDVPRLMRGADVLFFPTHYEPFGLVVTEAMASGVPAIVTRHAGAACVVEDGVSGWLLDNGDDLEGARHALTEVLEPSIRQGFAQEARQRAQRLSWEAMADDYERLIRECD